MSDKAKDRLALFEVMKTAHKEIDTAIRIQAGDTNPSGGTRGAAKYLGELSNPTFSDMPRGSLLISADFEFFGLLPEEKKRLLPMAGLLEMLYSQNLQGATRPGLISVYPAYTTPGIFKVQMVW